MLGQQQLQQQQQQQQQMQLQNFASSSSPASHSPTLVGPTSNGISLLHNGGPGDASPNVPQQQQQQQQLHHQYSSHQQQPSTTTNSHHQHLPPSFQPHQPLPHQQYDRSPSYLDSLSDSPSLSTVLSPHSEPFNPDGLMLREHQSNNNNAKSSLLANGVGLNDDPTAHLYTRQNTNPAAFISASTRPPRPSQNGASLWDAVHSQYMDQDLYATPSHPPQQQMSMSHLGHDGRPTFEVDPSKQGIYPNVMRNGSMHAPGGPYGTGSTLPESQQVAVNKAIQQQVQQLVQQQVQQHQQQQLHQQQHQFASQQQQLAATSNIPPQALAILNSLPPNISSRDYLLALQQVQNAQALAAVQGVPNGNVVVSSLSGGTSALNLAGMGGAVPPSASSQEEISTIFVVGFPDDMQEREFQNMFTFCQGFEAATLKVPHKELSSFGAAAGGVGGNNVSATAAQAAAAATLRQAGFLPPVAVAGAQGASAMDPYNLLTTNSGGVLADSRDATAALWNVDGDPYRTAVLNLAGAGASGGGGATDLSLLPAPPPRKQIIGFAKFRTRQEALDAREVLQGRRVDMEKGSMLKAEMAKKNLHTKRGVGPGGGSGVGSGGGTSTAAANGAAVVGAGSAAPMLNAETLAAGLAAAGFTAQQIRELNGLAGLGLVAAAQQQQQAAQQQAAQQQHAQQVQQQQQQQQQAAATAAAAEMFNQSQRERELNAIGAMGLNGLVSPHRDPQQQQQQRERDKERDQLAGAGGGGRMALNAYEAFHSVPASLPPRPVTFTTLPNMGASTRVGSMAAPLPVGAMGAGTNGMGMGLNGMGSPPYQPQQSQQPQQLQQQQPGGTTTPRHGSGGSAFGGMEHGLPLPPQLNGDRDNNGSGAGAVGSPWTNGFRDARDAMVDPLDTSGAMPSGPASVVGGPTSSTSSGGSGLHPAGGMTASHTLSRQPSSSFHQSPEQDHLSALSSNGNTAASDQQQSSSQHSPSIQQFSSPPAPIAQGQTLHQLQPGLYGGLNGLGLGPGTASSRGSAGSSSPPEKFQHQGSWFDQFNNGGTNSNTGTNGAGTPSGPNGYDAELARAMAGLAVGNNNGGANGGGLLSSGTHQDLTSPQLPSPGSAGGSGSGRPNAADQNPPINTLYVGNLPSTNAAHPSTLEDALRVLFSRCPGYRKLCFRQKSNGPMCFVEFDDVPSATKALNDLYGHTLNGLVKGGVRLSFSKNPLGVRAGSMSGNGGSLGASANLFSAALAGIGDGSRFSNHSHMLQQQQRHASLSGLPTYGADVPLPRSSRQESVDILSPSAFSSFGFQNQQQSQRSFSPSSYQQLQQSPPPPQQQQQQPHPSLVSRSVSMHSSSQQQQQQQSPYSQHHSPSLIDGLNHHSLHLHNLSAYGGLDLRDQHQAFSSAVMPPSVGAIGVNPNNNNNSNTLSSSPQPGVEA